MKMIINPPKNIVDELRKKFTLNGAISIQREISELFKMSASHLSHNGFVLATNNVLHAISREYYSRSPQNSSE